MLISVVQNGNFFSLLGNAMPPLCLPCSNKNTEATRHAVFRCVMKQTTFKLNHCSFRLIVCVQMIISI